ncbi:MAG: hypothetical protein KF851_00025 [Pirellulaceae bacterium]|nr:hypothetical protein [Pirellulaceae bacterium]
MPPISPRPRSVLPAVARSRAAIYLAVGQAEASVHGVRPAPAASGQQWSSRRTVSEADWPPRTGHRTVRLSRLAPDRPQAAELESGRPRRRPVELGPHAIRPPASCTPDWVGAAMGVGEVRDEGRLRRARPAGR